MNLVNLRFSTNLTLTAKKFFFSAKQRFLEIRLENSSRLIIRQPLNLHQRSLAGLVSLGLSPFSSLIQITLKGENKLTQLIGCLHKTYYKLLTITILIRLPYHKSNLGPHSH